MESPGEFIDLGELKRSVLRSSDDNVPVPNELYLFASNCSGKMTSSLGKS